MGTETEMDFKGHLASGLGFFIIFSFIYPGLDLISAIILAFISTFPDIDIRIDLGSHRNILTHSIIIPLIWLFIDTELVSLYFRICVVCAFGLHCICDVDTEIKGGGYTIKPRFLKFDYKKSTCWLLINHAIGLIMFLIYSNLYNTV